MIITYKIEFQSYWHIGSGLSGGTDVDALVLKDKNNFPHIPGKTLKGLIREAAIQLRELDTQFSLDINLLFGESSEDLEKRKKKNPDLVDDRKSGKLFFTNATLLASTQKQINGNSTNEYLFEKIASTKIESDTGIATKHSLREMEVCIPMTLYAQLHDVPEDVSTANLNKCLKMIKRMGVNRNRGLGRCTLSIVEPKLEEDNNDN